MQQPSDNKGPKKTPDEARQAIETGHMRYVLGISLALAIVALMGALLLA
jgi:hypothetical protein